MTPFPAFISECGICALQDRLQDPCISLGYLHSLLSEVRTSPFGGMRHSWASTNVPLCVLTLFLPGGTGVSQTRALGQIAKRGCWRGMGCQLVSYPHLFSKFLSSICTHTNTPSVEGNEIIFSPVTTEAGENVRNQEVGARLLGLGIVWHE